MMQVSAAGGLDSGREGRGWVGGTLGEELTGSGDGVQVGSENEGDVSSLHSWLLDPLTR